MDKIDWKILKELDINPRIPLSKLASIVRVSQQVADYRMRRLIKEGVIVKFTPTINLKALGLEHYRVFFTFNQKKEFQNESIFAYLNKRRGIYWAARVGGKYDLLIVLFVRDFEEFDLFMDDFNTHFPGLIKDYKSCYVIEHCVQKHKYLSSDYSSVHYGYNDKVQMIDELDKNILMMLKDDCRQSALHLSQGKDVSYKTIINRIKSLEQRKIILNYRLFMHSAQTKPYVVLFSFKNYATSSEKNVLKYLEQLDCVTQTVRLFGLWNLFVHVRLEDLEKLQEMVITLRDKFEIIDNYEIIPIFQDIAINVYPV